jgi:hypothetical protein
VSYRLVNHQNPNRRLSLSTHAWYVSLESAEGSGWNPMGAVPEKLDGRESLSLGNVWFTSEPDTQAYFTCDGSMVLLEDALNLADALDRAYLAFEPERVDWLFADYFNGFFNPTPKLHPSIGTIKTLADFCRQGAFWIMHL